MNIKVERSPSIAIARCLHIDRFECHTKISNHALLYQGLNILLKGASYFSETDLGRNHKFQCMFPGEKLEKLHLFIIFSEIRNHKNFKINQST